MQTHENKKISTKDIQVIIRDDYNLYLMKTENVKEMHSFLDSSEPTDLNTETNKQLNPSPKDLKNQPNNNNQKPSKTPTTTKHKGIKVVIRSFLI